MPTINVVDKQGKQIGEVTLSDNIFAVEINKNVMHMAVVNYLANQRQGTQSTLTRAEVRGGGIKPWRQKGTGRARQGSIRSPQWTHGGIALGPKPRSYKYAINKKTRRLALMSALSSKVAAGDLIIVDDISFADIKTKNMVNMLSAIGAEKALIITEKPDITVIKGASNIPSIKTALYNTINVYDILKYKTLVLSKDALAKIEEVYA